MYKYIFKRFTYLKELRERERVSIHWFTLQMTTVAGAGPGWSWSLELLPGPPTRWHQPKGLYHHPLAFPVRLAESWVRSRAAKTPCG